MKKLLLLFIGILSVSFSKSQILDWAKKIGNGSSSVNVTSKEVVVDQDGCSYYIGTYYIGTFAVTIDFDPGIGVSSGSSPSTIRPQTFLLKLDPNGNFLWKKLILGLGTGDGVYGDFLTIDSTKNIYFSGMFMGTVDFDPGAGVVTMTSASTSSYEPYFGKLDSLGNLIFIKQFLNAPTMYPRNIGVDKAGDIVLSGTFTNSYDFDPGPGVFVLSSPLSYASGFVLKTTNSGDFMWAKNTGIGTASIVNSALAIDTSGNIFCTGGEVDILKLDQAGDTVLCIQQEDTVSILVKSLAVDSDNNIIAMGAFSGTVDLDPGVDTAMYTTVGKGVFVQKFDSFGNLIWVKVIDSPDATYWVYGNDLKLDDIDNIYITGTFRNVIIDFDPGVGIYNMTPFGIVGSAYLLRLNSLGNFIWAFQITNGNCSASSLFVDEDRNVFTTGQFEGAGTPYTNFSPTGTFYLNASGGTDGYFAKYSQSITTEVSNIQLKNNFISIYPNPSTNVLFIETDEKIETAICVNYLGQSISLKLENNSCDVSGLSEGIYFISFSSQEGKVVTKKFIKN